MDDPNDALDEVLPPTAAERETMEAIHDMATPDDLGEPSQLPPFVPQFPSAMSLERTKAYLDAVKKSAPSLRDITPEEWEAKSPDERMRLLNEAMLEPLPPPQASDVDELKKRYELPHGPSRWSKIPPTADEPTYGERMIAAMKDVWAAPPLPFLSPFAAAKIITCKGGPADGLEMGQDIMPADGLICFFAEVSPGNVEQAVYRILRKLVEAPLPAGDEKPKEKEYEWIAEYVGKRRYTPVQVVNGIRKGS